MPNDISHPVTTAIRNRAPETNRDGWYYKVADAIERSEKAVKNWFYGDSLPDFDSYWRLAAYFGVDFHDEVTQALTGWCVSESPEQLVARLRKAAKHTKIATDILEGNVTRLPVEGKVS